MDVKVLAETTAEERLELKGKTESLDEFVGEAGFPCGLPAAIMEWPKSLVISDSFLKSVVEGLGFAPLQDPQPEDQDEEWEFRTSWLTRSPWKGQRGLVEIWRNRQTGKFEKDFRPFIPWAESLDMLGRTTVMLTEFGIEEAEIKARQRLESMLSSNQRRSYLHCESFYEQGRSGVIYWLRKNRPTVAIRPDKDSSLDGKGHPLCALCLHPLGWYRGSFAGIMAPSDDVMAHLLMIRANEHYFWRKANQHPLDSPLAGIL